MNEHTPPGDLAHDLYKGPMARTAGPGRRANPACGQGWAGRPGAFLALLWLAGIAVSRGALVLASGLGIANEPGVKYGAAAMVYYAGRQWETGYLNEGVNHGTDGVFVQYRLTRAITKRLSAIMALGPEVLNTTYDIRPGVRTNGYHLSLLVSLSASYRLDKRWRIGVRWNHITFQQSARFGYRDADMVVLTLGYGR